MKIKHEHDKRQPGHTTNWDFNVTRCSHNVINTTFLPLSWPDLPRSPHSVPRSWPSPSPFSLASSPSPAPESTPVCKKIAKHSYICNWNCKLRPITFIIMKKGSMLYWIVNVKSTYSAFSRLNSSAAFAFSSASLWNLAASHISFASANVSAGMVWKIHIKTSVTTAFTPNAQSTVS